MNWKIILVFVVVFWSLTYYYENKREGMDVCLEAAKQDVNLVEFCQVSF
jgi:hypothetical protein